MFTIGKRKRQYHKSLEILLFTLFVAMIISAKLLKVTVS
jgi:hypothetical protein